jgi:uncharacterized protein GlcG (DUF336 family)
MRRISASIGIASIAIILGAPAWAQQAPPPPLPYGMPISLEQAKKAAAAAEAEAKKNGFPSGIVIVGPNGEIIFAEKMDGSNNAVIDAAIVKAKGAALYRRPTKIFEDRLKDAPFLIGLADISVVGGGIPLVEKGHIVGAIGSSGAPSSGGDIQSAEAGVDALK